jgi:hypothetical protein
VSTTDPGGGAISPERGPLREPPDGGKAETPLRLVGLASTIIWLGFLWVVGCVVLALAVTRIGERSDTSFGRANEDFRASWGGPIVVGPPTFSVRHPDGASVVQHTLVQPREVDLDVKLAYTARGQGVLTFHAFSSHDVDRYVVRNTTPHVGVLELLVTRAADTTLLEDYRVTVDGKAVEQPAVGQRFDVLADFQPGADAVVTMTWGTNGVDSYRYRLSDYAERITPRLHARLFVDSNQFSLFRHGLGHVRKDVDNGQEVVFDLEEFSTSQDIGINFVGERQGIEYVRDVVELAPLSLAILLAVIFLWVQVQGLRPWLVHYAFVAMVDVFFFLFVGFLVRYVSPWAAIGIAEALVLAMAAGTFPAVFGPRFTWRVAVPYTVGLTVVFAALFMLPTLRALAFVTFVFGLLASIMVPFARADFRSWPVLRG